MGKRFVLFLMVVALSSCAIWLVSQQARADISQEDIKGQLISEANDISSEAEAFRELVRTEVSAEIIKAKGWGTQALALLSRRGAIQTSQVNEWIKKANKRIEEAQSGIVAARTFKEKNVEGAVQTLSLSINGFLAAGKITQTEATELQEILNNCLGGCLTSINQTLVGISNYLTEADSYFRDALVFVKLASPTTRDLRKAKSLVSSAMRKLERAWRGELYVKNSVKCLIYGLYKFKSAVLTAPLKLASSALSPELRVLGGKGGGPIRFLASGPEVEALRVQVFNLAGRPLYDSGFLDSNGLEWHPTDNRGEALANGVYLYIVTVRGYDGQLIRSAVRKLVVLR